MTTEQEQLLEILKIEFFQRTGSKKRKGFWEALSADEVLSVCKEAELQALLLPVCWSLQKAKPRIFDDLPQAQDFREAFSTHYVMAIRNLYDHGELHELLSRNGIRYCILKGQVSASYYAEPLLRMAGDVDFLVDRKDREKADRLLAQEGFAKSQEGENHSFHWGYQRGSTFLEMHWEIPGLPRDRKVLERYTGRILEDAAIMDVGGTHFFAPSRFHHGMILLLHALSHLTYTGMGLRHLLDWLVFEQSFSEREFLALYRQPLGEAGLWRFAQVMTRIGVLFFGCKERRYCRGVSEELCVKILEDILGSGNFGKKDRTIQLQTKIVRNTVTLKIGRGGMLRNLFTNVNAKARMKYSPSVKNPMLLPIGWGKVLLQYLHWTRSNRTNLLDRKLLANAKRRQELYARLHLFEAVPEKRAIHDKKEK